MVLFYRDGFIRSHTGSERRWFVEYKRDEALMWWRWYYVFGMLWIVQFVFACHQMVIAGAVGTWYFTRDKSKLGWPIAAATKRLIRYRYVTDFTRTTT